MKQVHALLKSTAIRSTVPKQHSTSNAVRLLYVEASINSKGYYRMILPSLELGKTAYFETRIISVKKWDFRQRSMTMTSGLFQEEEVLWADYIIFPMLWSDFTYLLKAIKGLNPNVQLVMDIVKDFDAGTNANANEDHLFHNICLMDLITVSSENLLAIYQDKLLMYEECSDLEMCVLPSLISKIGYEGLSQDSKSKDTVVRLGVICEEPYFDFYDFMFPVFRKLKEKYKDTLELIFLGSKGVTLLGESQEAYDLQITHHKTVSFLAYFQTLQSLSLDILMIPLSPQFNQELASTTRFLEGAAIGLPVIAPLASSYAEVIKNRETGILVKNFKDWTANLEELIESPEMRKRLGANAKKIVWEAHSYNTQTLQMFCDIFI